MKIKLFAILACLVVQLLISSFGYALTVSSTGIVFSDNSVQQKAAVLPTCSSGEVYVNNSGAMLCGRITIIPNGIATCVGSVCSVSSCYQGYVDNGTGLCIPAPLPITASINTIKNGSTAVGTVSTLGIQDATACGLSVRVDYPAGVTFVEAVKSGITPDSAFISPGTIGQTGTEVFIAGSSGFGSGEVMKVDFSNVFAGSLPSSFSASVVSVFDCNGVQTFP